MDFSDIGGHGRMIGPDETYDIVYPFRGATKVFARTMNRQPSDHDELTTWMKEKRIFLAAAVGGALHGTNGVIDYLVEDFVATRLPEDSPEHLAGVAEYNELMNSPEIRAIGQAFASIQTEDDAEE